MPSIYRRRGIIRALCGSLLASAVLFMLLIHQSVIGHGDIDRMSLPAMLMSSKEKALLKPTFTLGRPKPEGLDYTRTLVVAKTKKESTDWIARALPDLHTAIYVADDDKSPLHPPANKGHEAMVYLTYLIDNYYNLSDINIFMHSHRYAWHNAELLSFDS
ncbi:hypothetical protein KEM54_004235, partial [Ascosphaera aggregata]